MEKQALQYGRPAASLIGMPVYTLDSARKLGYIKDVIYDSMNSQLMAFTMEHPGLFSPKRYVLPFQNVHSVGRDAIMVENKQALVPGHEQQDISDIIYRGHTAGDKIVMTDLGRVSDVLINPDTGNAVSYVVSSGFAKDIGRGRNYVDARNANVIGPNAIIVPNDVETTLLEQQPGGMVGAYEGTVAKGQEWQQSATEYAQRKEIELSRGRASGKDVYDDDGYLIVGQGEVITEPVINRAVAAGKMHQVALAAGVSGAASGYDRARKAVGGAGEQVGTAWDAVKDWFSRTWANLAESSREYSSRAQRKRAVSAQKRFLVGKIAAHDVQDANGQTALHEGDVITPLILDTLDRQGLLENVMVKPEEEKDNAAVHLLVENPEAHKEHKPRAHI